MESNVRYLNAWLDCPDDVLRHNYKYQDKLNEAKAKFFYDMKEQGASQWQIDMSYSQFIYTNRDRLKIVKAGDSGIDPNSAG